MPEYKTRNKSIRDMTNFNMNKFEENFKLKPYSTVYSFDDPEEQ